MNLKEESLDLIDPYVYACIKRYMNNITKEAFPSLDTILEDTGLTKPTVLKSIKRLSNANYLRTEKKKGLSTRYIFNDYKKFVETVTIEYDGDTIFLKDIDVQPHFSYYASLNDVYDHKFSTFANQLCVYLGNKLGKANGVELRYPLLDVELIEFLDTLPIEMKFDYEVSKRFQKEVMKDLLPDYILFARKRGFEPPFDFIWEMCEQYEYKMIKSEHVFFNSMMADKLLVQLIG
jgi:hypothetical protein